MVTKQFGLAVFGLQGRLVFRRLGNLMVRWVLSFNPASIKHILSG
jgi:hypothetical protein